MTNTYSREKTIEALDGAVRAATLPAPILRQAKQLLKRLQTPVRVVFCGPANNLQQKVINRLLGQQLLPDGASRPTRALHFGKTASAALTFRDGRTEEVTGTPAPETEQAALLIKQSCNLPILKEFSILDLAAGESRAALNAAIRWAASRADIAVWCSQGFTAAEQKFWSEVPRNLQDHGFLVLTGTDQAGRAAALRQGLSGAFQDVLALDAGTASVDPLVARLRQHINLGQQDDLARASIFLRKHNLVEQETARPTEPTRGAQVRVVPFEPVRSAAADELEKRTGNDAQNQAVFRSGCAYIRDRAIELLNRETPVGTAPEVVSYFAETVRQLSDLLDTGCDMSDSQAQSLSDTLWEAEEILVLLEIEEEGTPEEDAAGLLLQIRQEFEARLVA